MVSWKQRRHILSHQQRKKCKLSLDKQISPTEKMELSGLESIKLGPFMVILVSQHLETQASGPPTGHQINLFDAQISFQGQRIDKNTAWWQHDRNAAEETARQAWRRTGEASQARTKQSGSLWRLRGQMEPEMKEGSHLGWKSQHPEVWKVGNTPYAGHSALIWQVQTKWIPVFVSLLTSQKFSVPDSAEHDPLFLEISAFLGDFKRMDAEVFMTARSYYWSRAERRLQVGQEAVDGLDPEL